MKKHAENKAKNRSFPPGIGLFKGVKVWRQTEKTAQRKTGKNEIIRQGKGKTKGGNGGGNQKREEGWFGDQGIGTGGWGIGVIICKPYVEPESHVLLVETLFPDPHSLLPFCYLESAATAAPKRDACSTGAIA